MTTPRPRTSVLGAAVLILAVLAVFYAILGYGFQNRDDNINVYQNPYFNPAVSWQGIAHFWVAPYYLLYMPVTDTLWAACAALARLDHTINVYGAGTTDLDAGIFHAVSLLLHATNTLLVFALLRRWTRDDLAATAGALLFAVHPVQVEAKSRSPSRMSSAVISCWAIGRDAAARTIPADCPARDHG